MGDRKSCPAVCLAVDIPLFGAFLQSADDQQVNLVNTLFPRLDFRRFQVDLPHSISMDDPSKIPELLTYGEKMGNMLLNDLPIRRNQ